ncbi:hypothetical protein Patl1_36162 [Pistacia atlantica]|nr:hypothetical protein Patl1_36162 [Pistacia atlantica]
MEYATKPEVAYDFSPVIIMYKDGRVEKLQGSEIVPPSLDPKTNVESKDVLYSPENGLSVRLHIPKNTNRNQKLPLLKLTSLAVSVEYRKAPEHPVPCAFDDSWTALQWVKSHVDGAGPEDWLNDYADFQRVFFCGDSAGATIAHHMGIRHGQEKLEGVNVKGIALCHPYFWGKEPVGDESTDAEFRQRREKYWRVACPSSSGCDDRWINPAADPNLARLGCRRVLIFVAEKDFLRARGWYYYEKLKESGWGGDAEITETEGEGHVFHVKNPACKNAVAMLKRIAYFFNQE